MSFTNLYKPPSAETLSLAELYGPDPYDLNFPFPIHLESLQTDRVTLTPFIPSVHAKAYWEAIAPHNIELFKYYPSTCKSFEEVLEFFELYIRRDPARIIFSIIDKTKPDPTHPEFGGSLAGVVGLYNTRGPDLASEIGHVLVFKEFHGTHVAQNAVGVLVRFCMDDPTASPPGLGLRRLQWFCHPNNAKSAGLAEKMGMKREGILRWHRLLSPELAEFGRKPRGGDPHYGRDTLVLSVCWDEWEAVRKNVQERIDRKA